MVFDDSEIFDTARSREDETRNTRRNANRNPEWWGDFSQLVKIEKLKFLGISRYKFELRFWLNLNSSVSRGTNSKVDFGWARGAGRRPNCFPWSESNINPTITRSSKYAVLSLPMPKSGLPYQ